MDEVPRILSAIEQGDPRAAEQLLPLVYDELHRLAAAKMARQGAGHTLQATALVHEAFLRLVKDGEARPWDGRGHFFAAAAEAMRRILVEHARRKAAVKHGGALTRRELIEDRIASAFEPREDLLALDEALDKLALKDPVKARLVNLRYFAGLTMDEAARALGISTATAERYWAYARAWLHRKLCDDAAAPREDRSSGERIEEPRGGSTANFGLLPGRYRNLPES
jgi:RNA polymerase sigma factor (TIGR02999 family)